MLRSNELIINDSNYLQHVSPVIDGEHKSRGLVPRNFAACPFGSLQSAKAFDLPLIPESEWDARYDEMVEQDGFLSSIRMRGNFGQMIPSLDQNGKGYCWAHSTTSAVLIARALANLPYVPLSAYSIACIIKNYRDEGGWCGESLDFLVKNGVASAQFWPMQSMSRSNDNAATRANMLLHKVTEGFYDLGSPIWNQKLTFNQLMTCLFLRIPCATDFNWWGHSVCAVDPVRISRGNWGIRIWNSWGDSWSEKGMGVLEGSKARPDGAVAIRVAGTSIS